jgi:hypothetical protein
MVLLLRTLDYASIQIFIALYMHKDYTECQHTLPTHQFIYIRACRNTSDANASARSHTPTHVPTRYVYITCTRTHVSLCALRRCCDQVLLICILFVYVTYLCQTIMHLQPTPPSAKTPVQATPPKPAEQSRCCTIL